MQIDQVTFFITGLKCFHLRATIFYYVHIYHENWGLTNNETAFITQQVAHQRSWYIYTYWIPIIKMEIFLGYTFKRQASYKSYSSLCKFTAILLHRIVIHSHTDIWVHRLFREYGCHNSWARQEISKFPPSGMPFSFISEGLAWTYIYNSATGSKVHTKYYKKSNHMLLCAYC